MAEWWDAPMRTEFGQRFRDLFEHPCGGGPYSPQGFSDADGHWVTVEDVIRSVRLLEDDIITESKVRPATDA
jgi:hypothetical protein